MVESLRDDNTIDVFNTVRMMRYQRPAMVQTAVSLILVYLVISPLYFHVYNHKCFPIDTIQILLHCTDRLR